MHRLFLVVSPDDEDNWVTLPNFPDPNKSTRRAIVEFAARIGRILNDLT